MTSPKTVTPDQPQAVPDMVLVPYDDFFAVYGFVPRSRMFPNDCLKTRLRSLLRIEDLAHADEAEALAARPVLPVETPAEGLREALAKAVAIEREACAVLCEEWTPEVPSYLERADIPAEAGASFASEILAVLIRARAAPAPQSGRNESLRELVKRAASIIDDFYHQWHADARAALATAPPETAEMEGAARRLLDVLDTAWKRNGIECIPDNDAQEAIASAQRELADRIAARASSSGEAGDE